MKIAVVGASGATGRLLVKQLLDDGHQVRILVRSADSLPDFLKNQENLSVKEAAISELSDADLEQFVSTCDALASCLGHNLTWKGVYGKPRRLVTDATRRLCQAVKANDSEKPIKFVLMNTTGNRNRDVKEAISFGQKCVIGLLRLLLPPHVDNEQAADYLRTQIGQNNKAIEWVAVRPDGLVDHENISPYEIHPSPTRSAIFNAGQTSRINVGHFMADLISDENSWAIWKGKMPVIYNRTTAESTIE